MAIPNFLVSRNKNQNEDSVPSFLKPPKIRDSSVYGHISNIGIDEPGISTHKEPINLPLKDSGTVKSSPSFLKPPSINNQTFYSNKGTPIKFGNNADDKASKAGSVAAGLLNGVSLGSIPYLLDKLQPGMNKEAQENHPMAYGTGNVIGNALPFTKGAKLVGKLPLLSKTANPLTKLITRPIEGAIVGSGMIGIEDKLKGKSNDETVNDMKQNAIIGGGIDLLLGLPGAAKYVKGINKNILDEALVNKFGQMPKNMTEAFNKEHSLSLGLPAPRTVEAPLNILPSGETIPMGGSIEKANPLVKIKKTRTETVNPIYEKYSGKYSVKNTEMPKAQQAYDDAVKEIQNYWGHWKLDEAEIKLGAEELGIPLDDILKNMENAKTNIKTIGNNARLEKIAGVNTEIPKLSPLNKTKVSIDSQPVFSGYADRKIDNPMPPKTPFQIDAENKTIATRLSKSTGRPYEDILNELKNPQPTSYSVDPKYSKEEIIPTLKAIEPPVINGKPTLNTNVPLTETSLKKPVDERPLTHEEILTNSDKWNDKSMPLYNRETIERNFEDIAGKDSYALKEHYIEPIKANETKAIKQKNELRDTVKSFNIKAGSLDSSLAQQYGEGVISLDDLKSKTDNWENVKKTADYMRKTYDDLIKQANDVLVANGHKPIAVRANYMPHQGEMDGIMKALGIENTDLPTEINGLTPDFKPNKNFFGNALQRKGERTVYDAVRGFDNYVEGVTKIIHHTRDIHNLRGLEKAIRTKYGDGSHLSNLVSYLQNYTNQIAGKQSRLDRGAEETVGRGVYKFADTIRKQVSANMIGGNISSALTNFIPLTQSLATTDKETFVKGMIDTISNVMKNDGFVEKSSFLTRRNGSDKLALSNWQKVGKTANTPFKIIDDFVGQVIVRGKYLEGIKKGMSDTRAMKYADNWAGRVMADRSLGMTPTLLNSKVVSLVLPFQTEVNNQMSFLLKDLPRAYKDDKLKLASAATQIALYSYLFNNLYEKAMGRRPAFDVLGVAEKVYNDYTGKNVPFTGYLGKEQSKMDKPLDSKQATKNLVQNVANQLPFSSVVTGGRIPMASALPDIPALTQGTTDLKTELTKPLLSVLPPTGGSQIKKTYEGLKAVNNGGVYNKNGSQLNYPVESNAKNKIQATLFGKSSLDETKEYYNNNRSPLSKEQTEKYQKDIAKGGNPKELYTSILDSRKVSDIKDDIYKLAKSKGLVTKSKDGETKEVEKRVSDYTTSIQNNKSLSTEDKIKRLNEYLNKLKEY